MRGFLPVFASAAITNRTAGLGEGLPHDGDLTRGDPLQVGTLLDAGVAGRGLYGAFLARDRFGVKRSIGDPPEQSDLRRAESRVAELYRVEMDRSHLLGSSRFAGFIGKEEEPVHRAAGRVEAESSIYGYRAGISLYLASIDVADVGSRGAVDHERQAVPPVRRDGAAVVAADADGSISPQEPVSIIAAGERGRRAVLVLAGVGLVERDPIACFGEPYIHDQGVAVEVGATAVGVETVSRRQRVAIANHGIGCFSSVDIG